MWERREKVLCMFEEFSLSGGQALVVLFWVILGLIFVWGLVWGRIRAK